ncbi:MAG: PAS domain S-box protein [Spirochaetaceae bacterium]|nr:MAG: PAS domain S-box protein [Spirochaetaceae bacterium]
MSDRDNPILNSPIIGCAYHRILLDDGGRPYDYEFLEFNRTFEKLTGLARDGALNRTVREVLPGIENGEFDWIAFYGEIALSGGEREFEQYSEPLGRWYRVHAYSTERLFFTTVFIDVTESKKEHEELEGFFTVNLDLLCIADVEGNFLKTNEAWSRILGYATKELNDRKFLDFVHPDDLPATLGAMSKLADGEEVLNFTNRYRSKDGSYRFIEWRSKPKGRYVYAAARDITDRKTAEQARLRLVEAATDLQSSTPGSFEYTGIVETALNLSGASYGALNLFDPDGRSFTTTAVAGIPDHITKATTMLGFPLAGRRWAHDPVREAVLGDNRTTVLESLGSLVSPGFVASFAERIAHAFDLGEIVVTRITTPDGILGDFTLLFSRGRQLKARDELEIYAGMVGVTLTRIRTEEQNARLVREKETLLKEVQHRIKNNMNVMTSLLSLQAHQVRGNRVVEDILNDVRSRFRSMQILYDRLYRTDMHDGGSLDDYLQVLVRQVVELFPAAARVRVTVESGRYACRTADADESKAPEPCLLDSKRLSTVGLIVNELVTNAMKYAFRDDVGADDLDIPTAHLTVTTVCREEIIEILVEDNGPGLPDSFDPANSSGFGVMMVQAMVGQLNGTVRYESSRARESHGTRVIVAFPRDARR